MGSLALLVIGWVAEVVRTSIYTFLPGGLPQPWLTLPLVVYAGLRRPLTEAVLVAFGLGMLADAFAQGPPGLFAFASLATVGVVRAGSGLLLVEAWPIEIVITFLVTLAATSLQVFVLRAMPAAREWSGPAPGWGDIATLAATTAPFGPLLFRLARAGDAMWRSERDRDTILS